MNRQTKMFNEIPMKNKLWWFFEINEKKRKKNSKKQKHENEIIIIKSFPYVSQDPQNSLSSIFTTDRKKNANLVTKLFNIIIINK